MIKPALRTPQEVANFYQKYVAQDEDGEWHMFDEKPELKKSRKFIDRWVSLGDFETLKPSKIANASSCDYEKLYVPQLVRTYKDVL